MSMVWHTIQNQTHGKESSDKYIYDEIFDIGSEMNADFIPFSTDDEDYVLWMWKGDYWNLGSGAEIGIYYDPDSIEGIDHYDVIDFELSEMQTARYRIGND